MIKMNGNWVKWVVGVLLPLVLGIGIWVGRIDSRVDIMAEDVKKIDEIDKKVTAILCKVAPEKCL